MKAYREGGSIRRFRVITIRIFFEYTHRLIMTGKVKRRLYGGPTAGDGEQVGSFSFVFVT